MQANFAASLALVLKSEGGYTDNPADPGGATNMGITLRTLAAWRGVTNLPKSEVQHLTAVEAGKIYKARYWNAIDGDALPAGVDYATFDYAVNSGPLAAAKGIQIAAGVTADGAIGPLTIAAAAKNPSTIVLTLCADRLAMLERLPTWHTFGAGWSNRIHAVRGAALQMVGAAH